MPEGNATSKKTGTKIEIPGFEAIMAISILLLARRIQKK
jgi:hypothetical protein